MSEETKQGHETKSGAGALKTIAQPEFSSGGFVIQKKGLSDFRSKLSSHTEQLSVKAEREES